MVVDHLQRLFGADSISGVRNEYLQLNVRSKCIKKNDMTANSKIVLLMSPECEFPRFRWKQLLPQSISEIKHMLELSIATERVPSKLKSKSVT